MAVNEQSLCIKKVAKYQVVNTTANCVAEAIHTKGTIYHKTVHMMIKDGVDEKLKEVKAEKKQTAQQKYSQRTTSPSKKSTRDATEGGSLSRRINHPPNHPNKSGAEGTAMPPVTAPRTKARHHGEGNQEIMVLWERYQSKDCWAKQ